MGHIVLGSVDKTYVWCIYSVVADQV